jgi:hypothetical protein
MARFLWFYEDQRRGLALIRGHGVRDVLDLAGVTTARWSPSGRGYVVPIGVIADVAAAAEISGVIYRTKVVTG